MLNQIHNSRWASCFVLLACATLARADERSSLLDDSAAQAHLKQLCVACHNAKKSEGKLRLDSPLAQFSEDTWDKVVNALHHLDMPPAEAKQQPSKEVRAQLEAWAQGHLDRHILMRAGDPGTVAWRRLTIIELENMVRDLTGRPIQVRDVLGQDTVGGEGFSNIGTAQSSMTASLLDKYLAMSSRVAEHARFDVDGNLVFDPPGAIVSPQVREDRAIIELQRLAGRVLGGLFLGPGKEIKPQGDGRGVRANNLQTEQGWRGLGRYLTAIWLASAAPNPRATLAALAERFDLNPRYLDYVWRMWRTCEAGTLEHTLWVAPLQALPKPASLEQDPPEDVRRTCDAVGSAFWQVLRQHNKGVIPRDKNQAAGFPCTTQPLFTVINGQRIQNRTSKKLPIDEAPVFVAVHLANGKPSATDVFLGPPHIRITETRTENVDGKNKRTTAVSWQPLPTDSLEPMPSTRLTASPTGRAVPMSHARRPMAMRLNDTPRPANQKWVEHAFVGFDDEPRSLPALAFRSSIVLRIDLSAVAALKEKLFDADGRFHKGVTVDVVFPVDVGGHDGLWRVSICRDRKDLDLPRFAELVRFPAGKADGIDHTWLAANRDTTDAYREQFAEMAQRWPPLAPLQRAPFGGARRSEVPQEMAYFRDDARMQDRLMTDAERKQADALWRYAFMLCGEHDRRIRRFEERFGLSKADREREEDIREILATRTPEGREPNHAHGVAPYDYVERWQYYQRRAAEDAAFWRKQTLAAVEDFATRAWRRPLTEDEVAQFAATYDEMGSLVARDAELVLRALLARVLLSPHFVYRVERITADGEESPLSAWELANRLSMTLWASLPDEELHRCAADGSLLRDEVLRAQTRRMLADPRAGGTGLAEHFFGQWLGFAGFGTATRGPDTSLFPEFTPQVRRSLHDEAIAFCEDLIRNDRDVRLMIDGDYSFLDLTLRSYYGLEPSLKPSAREDKSTLESSSAAGPPAAGLAVWLDASDASTIVQSGGYVRQWQDKSGQENHLTQTKNALQPAYKTDGTHSLPAVVFNRDILTTSDNRFAYDKHLILVVAQANQVGGNDFLGSGGTGVGDILLMNFQKKYRGHFWSGGKLTVLDSQKPAVMTPTIYVHHSNGERLSIRRNGSLDVTAPLGNAPNGKQRNLILGSRHSGSGSFVGQIAEVVVYCGDVSDDDVLRAEGYLAHKWKLADSLPADHPCKTVAPSSVVSIFAPVKQSVAKIVSPPSSAKDSRLSASDNSRLRLPRIPTSSDVQPGNGFALTDMRTAGRGGVLGLGAILINNSRQKRTSPTNRGVWVVEKLLGRHIPAPPPNVDPLPDEPQTNKSLSLLEQIRRHSKDPACASCHQRIDPYGFSLEAFDAIGRQRPQEFIDKLTFAEDRDGRRIEGMNGLQSYLRDHEEEVLRSLTRHFVGYALNRGTLVSDRPLIDRIVKELPKSDHRFSTIVEHVVLSRQFRFHR